MPSSPSLALVRPRQLLSALFTVHFHVHTLQIIKAKIGHSAEAQVQLSTIFYFSPSEASQALLIIYAIPRLYWIADQDQRVTEDDGCIIFYFHLHQNDGYNCDFKKIHVCVCLWPTLPHMTHFTRLLSTIITETQIWNWIWQLKTEILEIWYEKCSAKTRLHFETTILPATLIQIQFWLIVRVNYQIHLVSGHYIKSKSANRSKLRDLTALLH